MWIVIPILLGSPALPEPRAESPAVEGPVQAQDFEALQREWSDSVRAWKDALKEAKKAGKKRDEWPEDPTRAVWPRFEALADAGEGRAAVWMAQNLRDVFSLKERDREAAELFARVLAAGDAPWVADALEPLAKLRKELGADFDALVARLAAPERPAAVRMSALLVLADVGAREDRGRALEQLSEAAALGAEHELARADLARQRFMAAASGACASADSPLRPRALELLRQHARRADGTDAALDLERLLARLERLAVGLAAPDFDAQDVEGNAFKLSDYRGKVTVVDFWGFW